MPTMRDPVHRYHDGTKHHFHRFARSLGYLDWASQPSPFRSFAGAPRIRCIPTPASRRLHARPVAYDRLFDPTSPPHRSAAAVGDLLRHALGLSAWKQFRRRRAGRCASTRRAATSIRPRPTSSAGPLPGLAGRGRRLSLRADRHALEQRCAFDDRAWRDACGGRTDVLLVALTSIHWREAWKYGERAFRYCQHDLGHAIAAVAVAAAARRLARVRCCRRGRSATIAALTGIDRDEDFVEAEREEPGCLLAIDAASRVRRRRGPARRGSSRPSRGGRWSGRASQLSEDHVEWTFIDEIARATRGSRPGDRSPRPQSCHPRPARSPIRRDPRLTRAARSLQRRSAVAFDGRSSIDRGRVHRRCCRASMPRRGGAVGRAVVDAAHASRCCSSTASTASRRGCTCCRATPAAVERLRAALRPRVPVGAGRRDRCRSSAWRAATAARSPGASAAIRTSRPTGSSASG